MPVGHVAEDLGQAGRLRLVEPGGRLVEEQHLRIGGQGPAELHEPSLSGGQRVGPASGDRTEAEPVDELVGHGDRAPHRAPSRPWAAISAAVRMLSKAVIEPNTSSRWKVRFIPSRARWWARAVEMSTPSSSTLPGAALHPGRRR